MKLVNNLYYEVLHAHFNHVFNHQPKELLTREGDSFISDGYRFPPNFLSCFDLTHIHNGEDIQLVLKQEYETLKVKSNTFPQLEGVKEPTALYHEIWGVPIALKEIIVPHPNGDVSVVTYKYRYYNLWSLLRFITSVNSLKMAEIFSQRLQSCTITIKEKVYPAVRNTKPVKKPQEKTLDRNDNEAGKGDGFTTRMKCIAMIQMFTSMGVEFSKVNLAEYARFLHKFFSKPIPKDADGKEIIANSPLYKTIKTLYQVSPNRLKQDIKTVKNEYVKFDVGITPSPYKDMINQLENKILQRKK